MKTMLIAVCAVGGCTNDVTDPKLHALVVCGTDWLSQDSIGGECEVACATSPLTFGSGTCAAQLDGDPSGQDPTGRITCGDTVDMVESQIFEYDGVRGCCVDWLTDAPVQFAVCQ
jgi:hypothetical protein